MYTIVKCNLAHNERLTAVLKCFNKQEVIAVDELIIIRMHDFYNML